MPAPTLDLPLHRRQGSVLLSDASEILYGGAAGGGKSHLVRVLFILYCMRVPGLQAYIFRRTYPELWRNHMEGRSSFAALLAPLVKSGHVRINYSDRKIRFWNGSVINLCHCQHPKDVYEYQGAEIDLLAVDELTHWPKSMYLYLLSRLRVVGIELPDDFDWPLPRVINGTNPGGIGHNWVKARWVDAAPPDETWTPELVEPDDLPLKRQYVPARLDDNPTLAKGDPGYKSRLRGLGTKELVRALLEGDWNIVQGGMFDDLWKTEVHEVEPFKIPSSWYVDRAFDWGSSHPFSVGWFAESDGTEAELADGSKRSFPRGTLFQIGEWYGWNGEPDEGCRMASPKIAQGIKAREKQLKDGLGIQRVRPGPADNSIFDAIDSKPGDAISKKMAKQGVRWQKCDKSPGSRANGVQLMRDRLEAALDSPMELPGLFFFNTCRHSIRTIPTLPRDTRKPEDVDTKAEDHAYDMVRYRVLALKKPAGRIQAF